MGCGRYSYGLGGGFRLQGSQQAKVSKLDPLVSPSLVGGYQFQPLSSGHVFTHHPPSLLKDLGFNRNTGHGKKNMHMFVSENGINMTKNTENNNSKMEEGLEIFQQTKKNKNQESLLEDKKTHYLRSKHLKTTMICVRFRPPEGNRCTLSAVAQH